MNSCQSHKYHEKSPEGSLHTVKFLLLEWKSGRKENFLLLSMRVLPKRNKNPQGRGKETELIRLGWGSNLYGQDGVITAGWCYRLEKAWLLRKTKEKVWGEPRVRRRKSVLEQQAVWSWIPTQHWFIALVTWWTSIRTPTCRLPSTEWSRSELHVFKEWPEMCSRRKWS